MKQYNDLPITQNQQVKSETLNKNIDKFLSQYNGNLNGNNLPVLSISQAKLVIPASGGTTSGPVTKFSSISPTQNLYNSKRWSHAEGSSDVWTPIDSVNLVTDNWTRGWNKIEDISGWASFPIVEEVTEGMLVGHATIDCNHGLDRIQTGGDPVITIFYGIDWWQRWGVFVNDICVADSGQMKPGRITIDLPFTIPVGSQVVKIDIRWQTITSNSSIAVSPPNDTPFAIFGAELSVRNVKR